MTAVEWLEKQFDKYTSGGVNVPNNKIFKLTEQAKAMEKEQIMKAVDRGFDEGCKFPEDMSLSNSEQYYNETYTQGNE